ncbi:exodeoxyribonuclease VII small subunit [bacterium]|nr:exodeoxyribonuclease VII small subunit [bacterium]
MAKQATDGTESLSFEDSLERLEEIVGQLESGDAPLEEGLTLFEEGVALSRRCHSLLARVEQRIQQLVREEDGTFSLDLFGEEAGEEDE